MYPQYEVISYGKVVLYKWEGDWGNGYLFYRVWKLVLFSQQTGTVLRKIEEDKRKSEYYFISFLILDSLVLRFT